MTTAPALEPERTLHDSVVIYPTFGHQIADQAAWRIPVFGTAYDPRYEPEKVRLRMKILLRLLRRVMQVEPHEFESDIFQQRIRQFIASTEKGKQVSVRVGARTYRLQQKSRRNGHFRGVVRLGDDDLRQLAESGHYHDGWLDLEVVRTPDGDEGLPCPLKARAQLIGQTGLSVISDIDDTIKHTDVQQRREMLANTFLREFRAIEGMAERYQSWASDGTAFHYVSSSPCQLYAPLSTLCVNLGFPAGSFHLRAFRLRDHMLRRLLLIRRRGKSVVIRSIVKMFPGRRFVLVGDTGEMDPEIYSKAARQFGGQIRLVLLRQLPGQPDLQPRIQKAFDHLPETECRIFRDAAELPQSFSEILADD